jgi:hypothetical protein
MAVRHFTFDPSLTDSFISLGYDLYRDDANWIPPIREEVHAQFLPVFSFYQREGNGYRHFLARAGNKAVGRISAMVNQELRDKDGTPTGIVGFFETIQDFRVAQDLLDCAMGWLCEDRKVGRIWGPMNFDIWHGYRFMVRGFDQKLFYGEPYNKPWYPEFFERYGFRPKGYWDSVEIEGREKIKKMILRGAERYRVLTDRGYRFEPFRMNHFEEDLRTLHRLVQKSFGTFLGFTSISFAEFERFFARSRYALRPNFFTFVYDETHTPAGFGGAFLELSDAIRAMGGRQDLIAKVRFLRHRGRVNRINFYIGGMTPEEGARRSGLGRAGFYHVINEILKEGFERLLLTLTAKGNVIHGLLGKGAPSPQREYVLYELNR